MTYIVLLLNGMFHQFKNLDELEEYILSYHNLIQDVFQAQAIKFKKIEKIEFSGTGKTVTVRKK